MCGHPWRRFHRLWSLLGLGILAGASVLATSSLARAYDCTSMDPNQWPPPSKPYFMIVVDSSGSMANGVAGSNSCNYESTRIGHARCAVRNTVQAYAGEVNFGLASYAWRLNCPGGSYTCANCSCGTCSGGFCFPTCSPEYSPSDNNSCGPRINEPSLSANVHAGANIIVPMLVDHYWFTPPDPLNVTNMIAPVDNDCGNGEIGSASNTPLGGVLFNMYQYFSGTFHDPFSGAALSTPIGPATYNGQPAERPCRPISVILITDGMETCDNYDTGTYPNREGLAVYEAGRLFNTGVTVSGQNFKIKTYVIGFAGALSTALDHVAVAGGTNTSYTTANEAQLSQALANIIATAVRPEVCDNTDNNCNSCVDEGYLHYCNVQPVAGDCCTQARATCMTTFNGSHNLKDLPCISAANVTDPNQWLCVDPGEKCDNADNNCQNGVDEGFTKCGSPLHCPQTEVCNGQDDNCDGLIDEGGVCGGGCKSSPEVCDGCDNDCDGVADNGTFPVIQCGQDTPPNCKGQQTCKPPVAVPVGTCTPQGGYGTCTNNPGVDNTCNGVDEDCDGQVDEHYVSADCKPNGIPNGLHYGAPSQCSMGHTVCRNGSVVCDGFVGPTTEVCDRIDNNCDGQIDESPPYMPGEHQRCGSTQAPCTPGWTTCSNGVLVCTGGTQPQAEVCDGVDNDCDGNIDNTPLADAPQTGQNGCWTLPGNCCTFQNLSWCPPPNAGCRDNGSLASPPCNRGVLTCAGAQHWVCLNAKGPSPEICDGIDNDCSGTADDPPGGFPQNTCGSNVGECRPGTEKCIGGEIKCDGAKGPTDEICDGLDNNCNGKIDDGVPTGGPCTPAYDTNLFPGQRDKAPCQPGTVECDGQGGTKCTGGKGPTQEICDGIDNDCDGQVDEVGAPPDGIDGSQDPHNSSNRIGDSCGFDGGVYDGGLCQAGTWGCRFGIFACLAAKLPQPETCDCLDNDCNGVIDNENGDGGPPLCSGDKKCVRNNASCECASPCGHGEFPCPGGRFCKSAQSSSTGENLGDYCLTAVNRCLGGCENQTVKNGDQTVCAPTGTDPSGCLITPVCLCKGEMVGCFEPCRNVQCGVGEVCANFGSNAGKCVLDSCFQTGCSGCNKVCNLGSCVDNPCKPGVCPADQECKPKDNFTAFDCVKSCAGVVCDTAKTCVNGDCVDACNPPCTGALVCDIASKTCINRCVVEAGVNPCKDGSCCNPTTGACGNCPCEGILCPASQKCENDQCVSTGTGGSGGAGGSGGKDSGPGGGGGTGRADSGTGTQGPDRSVYGLATGGGGCACRFGGVPVPDGWRGPLLGLFLAGLLLTRRSGKVDGRRSRRSS